MAKSNIPREFLGAFKRGHRKSSKEFIDEELAERLLEKALGGDKDAEAALHWLTRFNNEFHKGVIKKDGPDNLHATPVLYKNCNDRNNARNKDMFTALDRVATGDPLMEYLADRFFCDTFVGKHFKK